MRLLSFCVALLTATTLSAQRLDYLTFRLLNGSEYSLNIASGATLTFASNNLVAHANGEERQFALADLSTFFFSASPTGINDVTAAAITAKYHEGALHVAAPAGSSVNVYSLDGRNVATLQKSSHGNERFTLSLNSGVYVVRVNQQTFKILAQ